MRTLAPLGAGTTSKAVYRILRGWRWLLMGETLGRVETGVLRFLQQEVSAV